MPRKSSDSAPGTFAARQVAPPLLVTRYVPPLPLAHTVVASTALTPRREARVLLAWGIQDCAYSVPPNSSTEVSFMCLGGRNTRETL